MKRLIFVIPIMVIVFSIATWMLNKDFAMIERDVRLMISGGAALFSGIISFFLMKGDAEHIMKAHEERQQERKNKR